MLARDAAGNETLSALRSTVVRNGVGSIAAAPGAVAAGRSRQRRRLRRSPRASTRCSLSARALPHRVEGGHAIVVAGIAKGSPGAVVLVTLQNAHRPSPDPARPHDHARRTARFRVSFTPHFSGRVRVRFAGDATHRAAAATPASRACTRG